MPRIKYTPPRSLKPNCFWLSGRRASSLPHREFVAVNENKENGPEENSIFGCNASNASQAGSFAFGTMYGNLQNIMAGGEDETDSEIICVLCGKHIQTIHVTEHHFRCMEEKQIELVYCTKPLCLNRGLDKFHFHSISETRVHPTQKPDSVFENLVGVVENGAGGGSKQHLQVCTGDKPFECSICHKSFVTMAGYDRHILIHKISRKPYECKTKTTFYTKTSLRKHQAIHPKEKLHYCDICERPFIKKSYLLIHKCCHKEKS